MKIGINKSAKRVLSITLALVMLLGTLFTANIGVTISADATTIEEGTIDLLEFGDYLLEAGSTSEWYDTKLADNGETGDSWENAIIIDNAEEFVYLAKASGNDTIGKYYKVADGIKAFDLSNGKLDFDAGLAASVFHFGEIEIKDLKQILLSSSTQLKTLDSVSLSYLTVTTVLPSTLRMCENISKNEVCGCSPLYSNGYNRLQSNTIIGVEA